MVVTGTSPRVFKSRPDIFVGDSTDRTDTPTGKGYLRDVTRSPETLSVRLFQEELLKVTECDGCPVLCSKECDGIGMMIYTTWG